MNKSAKKEEKGLHVAALIVFQGGLLSKVDSIMYLLHHRNQYIIGAFANQKEKTSNDSELPRRRIRL
jgi:hypothetical protein